MSQQQHPEGLLNPNCVVTIACPSCGHGIELYDQSSIRYLPGLPVGVKFDPSDWEILEHLEAKVMKDTGRMHPLINEFILTLVGGDGICSAHPEKLPGVTRNGQARLFFHQTSKAYSTGTRKRRKVQTNLDGPETRWHKTGHNRPILDNGTVKGFKKFLVLYTNFGRQRRPEKTNWVMHQYHLGNTEEEREGELVVSKVFYRTQPKLCGSSAILVHDDPGNDKTNFRDSSSLMDDANRDLVEPFDDIRSTFIGISAESNKTETGEKGVPEV